MILQLRIFDEAFAAMVAKNISGAVNQSDVFAQKLLLTVFFVANFAAKLLFTVDPPRVLQ